MFKVPQPAAIGRPLKISALVLRSPGSLVLLSAQSGGVHDVSGHVNGARGDERPCASYFDYF